MATLSTDTPTMDEKEDGDEALLLFRDKDQRACDDKEETVNPQAAMAVAMLPSMVETTATMPWLFGEEFTSKEKAMRTTLVVRWLYGFETEAVGDSMDKVCVPQPETKVETPWVAVALLLTEMWFWNGTAVKQRSVVGVVKGTNSEVYSEGRKMKTWTAVEDGVAEEKEAVVAVQVGRGGVEGESASTKGINTSLPSIFGPSFGRSKRT